MKDAAHHIKRVQKKVIQASRKSSGGTKSFARQELNNTNLAEDNFNLMRIEKRADTNHRVPRLPNNRSMIH